MFSYKRRSSISDVRIYSKVAEADYQTISLTLSVEILIRTLLYYLLYIVENLLISRRRQEENMLTESESMLALEDCMRTDFAF